MTKVFFFFSSRENKNKKTMVEMTGFLYVVRYVNLAHAKKNLNHRNRLTSYEYKGITCTYDKALKARIYRSLVISCR